jgi:Uma2 family endonuclease
VVWYDHHPVPPDLAGEIVSPSDRPTLVTSRVWQDLHAGVPLVWVVEPEQRSNTSDVANGTPHVHREAREIDGGEVIQGPPARVGALAS